MARRDGFHGPGEVETGEQGTTPNPGRGGGSTEFMADDVSGQGAGVDLRAG